MMTMEKNLKIKIKKLTPSSRIPLKGSSGAAGYDLYSDSDYRVMKGERVLIKTGISIEIPEGYYGRIAPRSGLALKHGIDVLAGVIDSDYRGEIGVILLNTDENFSFPISKGDRVAQIIFEKCMDSEFIETVTLENSSRLDGGFGSTGK